VLPLLVPHVVLASGVFAFELYTHSLESLVLLLLAQATLAVPYTTMLFLNAVDTIDPLLWPAASTLGANWLKIVRMIVLPILAPTFIVAAIFAFQTSWDETAFAKLIGPGFTPTIPVRMYQYLTASFTPVVAAVSTLLLGFSVLIGLLSLLTRRRLAARKASTLVSIAPLA
jgi:ABC-type spermidine/putrescine transport system permease subunit II